jgi:hypothetical protein
MKNFEIMAALRVPARLETPWPAPPEAPSARASPVDPAGDEEDALDHFALRNIQDALPHREAKVLTVRSRQAAGLGPQA